MSERERSDVEGHPTAAELVEAAREHLVSRVIPTITDARLRFQTLVAAHVLEVVARESRRPEVAREALTAARRGLFDGDDAALVAAIDAGGFDDPERSAALRGWLMAECELGLASWNPAFLASARGR